MTAPQLVWATTLITALMLVPVGAIRMLVYKSGETDHTPTHRFVAWLALAVGGGALLVCLGLTVWFLATGRRPL